LEAAKLLAALATEAAPKNPDSARADENFMVDEEEGMVLLQGIANPFYRSMATISCNDRPAFTRALRDI